MAPKPQNLPKRTETTGSARIGAISRRGLSRLLARAVDGRFRVIWLHGTGDSGCSRALARQVCPELAGAITDFCFAADFRPAVFRPSSDRALRTVGQALAGQVPLDLLIVEGAVPAGGACGSSKVPERLVPFETWVRDMAAVARRVVAVGTCAGCSIAALIGGKPLLSIPGCPAPAERILLTLAGLFSGSLRGLAGHSREFHERQPEPGTGRGL